MKAIVGATLISGGRKIKDRALVFDKDILALCAPEEVSDWAPLEIIDADDCLVTAGFIDIHIHGIGGYDTMDGKAESLSAMGQCLLGHGVTSFLATTMSAPWEELHQVFAAVESSLPKAKSYGPVGEKTEMPCMPPLSPGALSPWALTSKPLARCLGLNLEGPWLNPLYKGAHQEEYLSKPDFAAIEPYLHLLRIVTLAPELPGSEDFLLKLRQHPHIIPAIGHSGADYEGARQSFEWGIAHITHLFNAMSPLHQRAPGVVGAALTSGLSSEVIADNLHVHPALYELLLKTHGSKNLILVSDASRAATLTQGDYDLGGQTITVRDGAARLPDGTLAGSVLTLDQALINFGQVTGLPVASLLDLVTRNPARLLGLADRVGDLQVGMAADIVVLNRNLRPEYTFVGGQGERSTYARTDPSGDLC